MVRERPLRKRVHAFVDALRADIDPELGPVQPSTLEAAARGLVRRLRNRLIADLGTDGRRDDAARAVADAVERSLVLAHHFLATDGPPPEEESELLDSLSEAAGVDGAPAKTLLAELRGKGRLARPVEAAGTLLPWLEGVAAHIDRLGDG